MKCTKYSGVYLIATGLIHNFIGVIVGWEVLAQMIANGWWDTVEAGGSVMYDRSAITWFLSLGAFWILLGLLMQSWLRKTALCMPRFLGIGFIIFGLLVGTLIPVSGAWLFIPQGLLIIFDSVKGSKNETFKGKLA